MSKNPIAFAVPLFFLLIAVELLVARRLGRRVYRLNDSFADLGCGIAQQVLGVAYSAILLSGFAWLHARYRVIDLESSPVLLWTIAIVGTDFLFYWWHRASHRVNALWAAHVVHHQSEDMNLAVALRQAPLTSFTILPFYLPLAFVLPPTVLGIAASLNTLYQFWIHSELIPKLGPVEWLLNTPSHHRAHHGINPIYIDKNYGGILIVWDRLFGTFEEESEPVVYGTVEPLRSFDPLWAQVHPWVVLARVAAKAPRFRDKVLLWVMPPDWTPEGVPPHAPPGPVSPETRPRWDVALAPRVSLYLLAQLAFAVVVTFLMLLYPDRLGRVELGAGIAIVLLTLFSGAALIERRSWAWPVEASRLALAGLAGLLVVVSRGD